MNEQKFSQETKSFESCQDMDSFEQRNETATKKSSQTSNKAITQSFDTLKLETFPEEGSSIPLVANSTENEEAKKSNGILLVRSVTNTSFTNDVSCYSHLFSGMMMRITALKNYWAKEVIDVKSTKTKEQK